MHYLVIFEKRRSLWNNWTYQYKSNANKFPKTNLITFSSKLLISLYVAIQSNTNESRVHKRNESLIINIFYISYFFMYSSVVVQMYHLSNIFDWGKNNIIMHSLFQGYRIMGNWWFSIELLLLFFDRKWIRITLMINVLPDNVSNTS